MEEAAHRNTDLSSVGLLPGQRKGLIKVTSFYFFFSSSCRVVCNPRGRGRCGLSRWRGDCAEKALQKGNIPTQMFFFSGSFFFLFF